MNVFNEYINVLICVSICYKLYIYQCRRMCMHLLDDIVILVTTTLLYIDAAYQTTRIQILMKDDKPHLLLGLSSFSTIKQP